MGVELSQCPSQYKDLFYIQRKGVDKDFNKLKLKLADFFDIQPEQKFETFPKIYKENLWLRLRALIGADYRADVIYLKMSGLAKNQVQAAKVIGCNKSSVNRIWNSIEDFDSLVSHIK